MRELYQITEENGNYAENLFPQDLDIAVTVHTCGANSNGIQPIKSSPLAKGWILGYSTFLAHSFPVQFFEGNTLVVKVDF